MAIKEIGQAAGELEFKDALGEIKNSEGETVVTVDGSQNATFAGNVAIDGAATIGNAAGDAHVLNGSLQIKTEQSGALAARKAIRKKRWKNILYFKRGFGNRT